MNRNITYGLIPARGGSEGLPGKNLRLLNGKPLITHIVRAALAAKKIDSVFVSTDSEEIGAVARACGAKVIIHPAKLSSSTASTFGVIQNAVKVFRERGQYPNIVVTMRPTSPLCLPTDIDQAIKLLLKNLNTDSVISVVKSDVHPYRILRINNKGELEHFDKQSTEKNFPQRRQTFSDVYIRNGAIYVTRTHVIGADSLWGGHSIPFIMPKERSININDEMDFLLAESLISKIKI